MTKKGEAREKDFSHCQFLGRFNDSLVLMILVIITLRHFIFVCIFAIGLGIQCPSRGHRLLAPREPRARAAGIQCPKSPTLSYANSPETRLLGQVIK